MLITATAFNGTFVANTECLSKFAYTKFFQSSIYFFIYLVLIWITWFFASTSLNFWSTIILYISFCFAFFVSLLKKTVQLSLSNFSWPAVFQHTEEINLNLSKQKQSSRCTLQKSVLKNFPKLTWKHLP